MSLVLGQAWALVLLVLVKLEPSRVLCGRPWSSCAGKAAAFVTYVSGDASFNFQLLLFTKIKELVLQLSVGFISALDYYLYFHE